MSIPEEVSPNQIQINEALIKLSYADTFHDFGKNGCDSRCRITSLRNGQDVPQFHKETLDQRQNFTYDIGEANKDKKHNVYLNMVSPTNESVKVTDYENNIAQSLESSLIKSGVPPFYLHEKITRQELYKRLHANGMKVANVVDTGSSIKGQNDIILITIASLFDTAPHTMDGNVIVVIPFEQPYPVGGMDIYYGYDPGTSIDTSSNFITLGNYDTQSIIHQMSLDVSVVNTKPINLKVSNLCKFISTLNGTKHIDDKILEQLIMNQLISSYFHNTKLGKYFGNILFGYLTENREPKIIDGKLKPIIINKIYDLKRSLDAGQAEMAKYISDNKTKENFFNIKSYNPSFKQKDLSTFNIVFVSRDVLCFERGKLIDVTSVFPSRESTRLGAVDIDYVKLTQSYIDKCTTIKGSLIEIKKENVYIKSNYEELLNNNPTKVTIPFELKEDPFFTEKRNAIVMFFSNIHNNFKNLLSKCEEIVKYIPGKMMLGDALNKLKSKFEIKDKKDNIETTFKDVVDFHEFLVTLQEFSSEQNDLVAVSYDKVLELKTFYFDKLNLVLNYITSVQNNFPFTETPTPLDQKNKVEQLYCAMYNEYSDYVTGLGDDDPMESTKQSPEINYTKELQDFLPEMKDETIERLQQMFTHYKTNCRFIPQSMTKDDFNLFSHIAKFCHKINNINGDDHIKFTAIDYGISHFFGCLFKVKGFTLVHYNVCKNINKLVEEAKFNREKSKSLSITKQKIGGLEFLDVSLNFYQSRLLNALGVDVNTISKFITKYINKINKAYTVPGATYKSFISILYDVLKERSRIKEDYEPLFDTLLDVFSDMSSDFDKVMNEANIRINWYIGTYSKMFSPDKLIELNERGNDTVCNTRAAKRQKVNNNRASQISIMSGGAWKSHESQFYKLYEEALNDLLNPTDGDLKKFKGFLQPTNDMQLTYVSDETIAFLKEYLWRTEIFERYLEDRNKSTKGEVNYDSVLNTIDYNALPNIFLLEETLAPYFRNSVTSQTRNVKQNVKQNAKPEYLNGSPQNVVNGNWDLSQPSQQPSQPYVDIVATAPLPRKEIAENSYINPPRLTSVSTPGNESYDPNTHALINAGLIEIEKNQKGGRGLRRTINYYKFTERFKRLLYIKNSRRLLSKKKVMKK